MLDGLGGCRGSCACQGLSYVPKIIRIELTSHFDIEKTRELVARKYYGDLQLVPIPTHRRKGTSYDSILVIVGQLTKMKHKLGFDPFHCRLTRSASADTNRCTWTLRGSLSLLTQSSAIKTQSSPPSPSPPIPLSSAITVITYASSMKTSMGIS